jgi:hypothetical protein
MPSVRLWPYSAVRLAGHTGHWGQRCRITSSSLPVEHPGLLGHDAGSLDNLCTMFQVIIMPSSSGSHSVIVTPKRRHYHPTNNIRNHPPSDRAAHLSRLQSSLALLWEPKICFRSMKYKLSFCSRLSCIMKLDVLLIERDVLWNFDTWMSSTLQNLPQHCSHICSRNSKG